MRMKSVHLDRKLSATARLPKRSTIVESPAGKSVHPTDVVHSQRSQELAASRSGQSVPVRTFPAVTQSQQPHLGNIHQTRPNAGKLPSQLDMSGQQGQVVRPAVSRTTTEVKIVDDSVPNSPAIGPDEPQPSPPTALDDGITLADIPQLMEAAQAREQQRSLPRESHTPYIAELNSLELAIVKHCAVLALHRSALKDQFDLDELLELVEMKKSGFWNKLFKAGNDKKNVKKKGKSYCFPLFIVPSTDYDMCQAFSVYLWNSSLSERVLIRSWVRQGQHLGYRASLMTLSLPCDKWVRVFLSHPDQL